MKKARILRAFSIFRVLRHIFQEQEMIFMCPKETAAAITSVLC